MRKLFTIVLGILTLSILLIALVVFLLPLTNPVSQFGDYKKAANLGVSWQAFKEGLEYKSVVHVTNNRLPIMVDQVVFRLEQRGTVISEVQANTFLGRYEAMLPHCPIQDPTKISVCDLIVSITHNGTTENVTFLIEEQPVIAPLG